MKYLLKTILLLSFALNMFSLSGGEKSGWYEGAGGYADALERAEKENRTLFVYFKSSVCGLSEKCDEGLEMVEKDGFFSDMIRVRLAPQESEEEQDIADKYHITGFPAIYITPAGLDKWFKSHPFVERGGKSYTMSPKGFAKACRNKMSKAYSDHGFELVGQKSYHKSGKFFKLALENNENNIDAYYGLAVHLRQQARLKKSLKMVDEAELLLKKALKLDMFHLDSKKELKTLKKLREKLSK